MFNRLLLASCLLVGLSLSVLFFSPLAFAQDVDSPATTTLTNTSVFVQPTGPINLTLSPVTINLEANPGETVTASIKIRNNSSETERLQTSLGSFEADQTGQRPILLDPDPNEEFLRWLTVSEPSFEVPPNEWKTIQITFSPPESAALSYYYALYFQREAANTTAPGEAKIVGSPAILILTTVKSPNAIRQLELTALEVERPFSEFLPQTFEVVIKNTGNVHIVPAGNIFIDGQRKQDLAVLSINPSLASILPQSTRTFSVTWNDGFPFKYSASTDSVPESGIRFASLQWDFSKANTFRFGPYTAHLLMVYDNGERDVPIESFAHFWIVPWKLMLIALAVFLLSLVGLSSIVKMIWKIIRSIIPGSSRA